jgi:4-hydroxy-2-oxoheptanedioate aldolase
VKSAVEDAIRRIRSAGKPAGILTPGEAFATRCIELGTTFAAVDVDAALMARQTERLARRFTGR